MSDLEHLSGRIAAREAAASPSVLPGCEARVIWAGARATQTDVSVVYIHGFSASPEEIRPVPDKLAEALGANLFFARLTGHGQGGEAMGTATLAAWRKDVDYALEVGRALGRRTLLMGCSTGCTLNTLAAASGAELAGVIHVSPNFGMASRSLQWMLDAPGVWRWGPLIMGRERKNESRSEAHAKFNTLTYPTIAARPMADAIRAARLAKLGTITAPALCLYSEEDQIVSPAATKAAMLRWGGPSTIKAISVGPGDDIYSHVIAGDVLSPSMNVEVSRLMINWAGSVL